MFWHKGERDDAHGFDCAPEFVSVLDRHTILHPGSVYARMPSLPIVAFTVPRAAASKFGVPSQKMISNTECKMKVHERPMTCHSTVL
jgi:hypothetical protein